LFDAALAMSRQTSIYCSAFAKRATVAKSPLIATALLQLILLEPTHAADGNPDECGLASVYSSVIEETASGEDTSAKNLTAAHRSLPFGTLVKKTAVRQSSGSPIVALTSAEE
jgi:rare lipoprotein A (peptidoglycan hydrolase)